MPRSFSSSRRIVVKIGTNVLATDRGVDQAYIAEVARQVQELRKLDKRVLVVSSGAIGMGAQELGITERVEAVAMRQACAAIGQPLLMQSYRDAFSKFGVTVSQVLLTREVLNDRRSYVNLRNAVETLLELGVVPIFNENDSVSTAEIGNAFGDNDQLSALVASKTDADVLIILTDIDALYDADPRSSPHAQPVRLVEALTPEIFAYAGASGSRFGSGGMYTKLKAVQIAERAGCRVILAHGRESDVLPRLIAGEEIGTLFLSQERLKNRSRWILNSEARGRIAIDAGAEAAIRRHNSLLPPGIVSVEGLFPAGAVVELQSEAQGAPIGKMVSSLASTELRAVVGKHTSEVQAALGPGSREIIARPEDIVFYRNFT
jgi:glutamate 5-kinase